MSNVTGYNELINGSLVEAGYVLYDTALKSNFLLVIFISLQLALLMKTNKAGLSFGIGVIFFAMFYTFLSPLAVRTITTILILELAGTLYQSFHGD